ncbi:Hypothetical protein SMAX5B_000938 [Scophthalmus maximus]|uniref:Uncharacterized protein n=1 Tax=Scophthalmus maximus TaxID=52904 RepID=A0A2U9C5V0_SCOMX|nr:Hypothetical protein SMAX5B_000938 [Scophthalmus maximus]
MPQNLDRQNVKALKAGEGILSDDGDMEYCSIVFLVPPQYVTMSFGHNYRNKTKIVNWNSETALGLAHGPTLYPSEP